MTPDAQALIGRQLDIHEAVGAEVVISSTPTGGLVVYVNVAGITIVRLSRPLGISIRDERLPQTVSSAIEAASHEIQQAWISDEAGEGPCTAEDVERIIRTRLAAHLKPKG